MQEARHYGYSQIHIEVARKDFIVLAFALHSFEITRPLGSRPAQKHGIPSNQAGIVAALQRLKQHILAFPPQRFAQEQVEPRTP